MLSSVIASVIIADPSLDAEMTEYPAWGNPEGFPSIRGKTTEAEGSMAMKDDGKKRYARRLPPAALSGQTKKERCFRNDEGKV